MALIKCKECGKEISEQASSCPKCGCPTKENKIKNNKSSVGINIWLSLCVFICFIISLVDMFNLIDIENITLNIGNFDFYIMSYFAFILGVSYILLLKNKSKRSFHILLGVNAIILLYNFFNIKLALTFKMGLSVIYIFCVFANTIITTLVIRKHLNNNKLTLKNNKLILAFFIVGLIGLLAINFSYGNSYPQTNKRNENVAQVEIVTDYINIRRYEAVDSEIIGKVYKGEIYTIINENKESEHNWLEIKTSNGINGYISGIDTYVKRLYTLNNEEQPPIDNPIIDNNNTSNENNTNTNDNQKPNNNTNNNQKPNNNPNTNNNANIENNNQNNNNNNQNSSNNQNTSNNDNNTTNKPQDTQTKEIDATLEYYCSSSWRLSGKSCEKIDYSGKKAERRCSFGYVMSADGTKCIGESRPDKDPTESPTCVGGSNSDIYTMTAPPYYGCRKGTLTFKRTCPTGYSLITAMGISKCTWDYTGKETYVSSNCSYPYPVFDKESGQCVNRTVKSAYTKYTCPTGYTLKNQKCYK